MTAGPQGGSAPLPLMYIPNAGVMEDGTIQLQVSEDGKLILPPGLKLFTADGQEVGCGGAAQMEDTNSGQPTSKSEEASNKPEPSSSSSNNNYEPEDC